MSVRFGILSTAKINEKVLAGRANRGVEVEGWRAGLVSLGYPPARVKTERFVATCWW